MEAETDSYVFKKNDMVVLCYVDDFLLFAEHQRLISETLEKLNKTL